MVKLDFLANIQEEQEACRKEGVIEAVDFSERGIEVGGEWIYIRGRWKSNNQTYRLRDVIYFFEEGDYAIADCERKDKGLFAVKIEIKKGIVLERGEE